MNNKNDSNSILPKITALLEHIDPDVHYDEWIRVLMVIFYETKGSQAGFELADYWSSQGYKYKGVRDVRARWRCFKPNIANPVRMGTLVRMAKMAA